jgi:hypothetical protein
MKVSCPKCGYLNEAIDHQCGLCGEPLKVPFAGQRAAGGEQVDFDATYTFDGEAGVDSIYQVLSSPFDPKTVRERKRMSIGRDAKNDVRLASNLVSRFHATIEYVPPEFVIRDMGSENATYVNGQRIKSRNLKEGDNIQIGPYILKFVTDPGSAPGLSGDLSMLWLGEVCASIAFNKTTGSLNVRDAEGRIGQIKFYEGEPVDAKYKGVSREEAIIEMLGLTAGTFGLSSRLRPSEKVIEAPLKDLVARAFKKRKASLDTNRPTKKLDPGEV